MKNFKEANIILAETQEEYNSLEINANPELPEVPMTAKFSFTDDQIEYLKANKGDFFVTQQTFGNNFHPINVTLDLPDTISHLDEKGLQHFYVTQNIKNHHEAIFKLKESLLKLQAERAALEKPIDKSLLN